MKYEAANVSGEGSSFLSSVKMSEKNLLLGEKLQTSVSNYVRAQHTEPSCCSAGIENTSQYRNP